MKQGTLVDVAGRGLATVVYNNLDGHGVAWGIHLPPYPMVEAMLRDPYPGADIECVGTVFDRVSLAQEVAEIAISLCPCYGHLCANCQRAKTLIKRVLAGEYAAEKVGCCGHDSDCAVHNAPALSVGSCDCELSAMQF
jgi:hypothetical protein